jgi:GNAT superfamily N-acetyltransferase
LEVNGRTAGIARSISDFSYVAYLSDIVVRHPHQRSGIGRALIEVTRKEAPRAKIAFLLMQSIP